MAEIIEEPTALSKVIALKFKINDVDVPKTTQLPTNKQFNTTDTDAWFTFELDGLASTSGTYNLTLINLDDKSIFHHADVIFPALPFHYKLNSSEDVTLNEIRHAGRWLGQLVVTMSNGDTTARQFGFNIAGHILDGQDAQVILLSDYQALINTINLAKDDLAQYNVDYAALIADVTTAEGLREQAEIDRAAAFAALVESEMIAQNVATKLTEKEATFALRMLSLESELADIKPTGIVSFVFDDNGIADAALDDIFSEYGFVFSNACIVAGNINNSASNVGLFELIQRSKKGFNLLSHGVDSAKLQTSLGYGKAWSELKNSRDTLRRWGFQCNGFVCPNNYLESIYVDYVKRNYAYAFKSGQSNIAYYPPMKTNQDRYAMLRFHIDGNGAPIADIKTLIDNTVEQSGLTVFYGHSLATSDGTYTFSEARIREILAYCQTKVTAGTLAVMNTDEAVNRFFGVSFPYTQAEYATANLSPSIETFVYQKAAGTAKATKTTGVNTLTLSFPIDTIVQRAYLNATLASAITSDGYTNRVLKLAVMASSSKEVTVKNRIKFTNSVNNEFANADIVYVNGVPAIKIESEHATKISLVGENISVQIWYEIECPIYTEPVTVTLTNSILQLSV